MTGRSLRAGCLHSLVPLPAARPRPPSAAAPQTGLCSASVRCLLFPWIPVMAPPLLGHSLPPPPRRRDEPNGLGRRKVPDKQVLAPQPAPRGIATVPMQIHGVITLGRREIRRYLALDKPSRAVTQRGEGNKAACCTARLAVLRPACARCASCSALPPPKNPRRRESMRGFLLWLLSGRCTPSSSLKEALHGPGPAPDPRSFAGARRGSQGCTIPVPRDAGACGPAGIQHPPCLRPGTLRV